MVYDGAGAANVDRLKIYHNGELQSLSFIGTIDATTPDNAIPLEIGREYQSNIRVFNGKIATPRIYTTTLTQPEITQNFNATRNRFGI